MQKNIWIAQILTISFLIQCAIIVQIGHTKRGIGLMPISPDGRLYEGQNWLLVIGINTYTEFPKLSTAVNDAQEFKRLLIKRYYFSEDRTLSFFNVHATRRNIINGLKKMAKNISPNDQLVIFYAGHGHIDPITKLGSWIPVDAEMKDSSARISNYEIKSYMSVDAIKAKHILLISDSCFAGDFFRGNRSYIKEMTPDFRKIAWQLTSRMAITSGGIEPVVDEGFNNHSIFSYFLLKELEKNQSAFLTVTDLFSIIKAGVGSNAKQKPMYGILRDTGAQEGGEFIFFLDQVKEYKEKENYFLELQKQALVHIAYEQKMKQLDRNIVNLQEQMKNSFNPGSKNSMEELFKIIEEKERQQAELQKLKTQYQMEKVKYYKTMYANLSEEIATYKQLVARYNQFSTPPFPESYLRKTWDEILSRYPEIENVSYGDTSGLLASAQQLITTHLPKTLSNKLGMTFVRIPFGTFIMGSPPSEQGRDRNEIQHEVTLTQTFYLQTTEVTQKQWRQIMGSNPSEFQNCGDNCPVEKVSWDYVQRFIEKLNQQDNQLTYRLPTEAEWEYAARADNIDKLYTERIERLRNNNPPALDLIAWYGWNSCVSYEGGCDCNLYIATQKQCKLCGPHPVRQKKPNQFGLYDMIGNVNEWCQDWDGDYSKTKVIDPSGPNIGLNRILRGCWWASGAEDCRPAKRGRSSPYIGSSSVGFRLLAFPSLAE